MGKKKNKHLQRQTAMLTEYKTIYGSVGTTTPASTGQTRALVPIDLKNHGIILQKHSIIQKMYEQSGPNAKSNEFQMHYWMLVFRHTFDDGGFFDVAVPTCYFNYEQFVSVAHVDFEMKDVSELSEKLAPLHNMITNQILATSFKSDLETLFGVPFEPISVDVGTLHRHPGSSYSQRFSGTDLDANTTNHGIVFPLKSGVDKPSFSGILAVDGTECNVAHYEYRLVNGAYETNDMTYTKGRCLAITLNDTYTPPVLSAVQRFFGVVPSGTPLKTKEDSSLVPQTMIQTLNSLITLLPDPNIQLIRSENVKTRVTTTVTRYTGGGFTGSWINGAWVPNAETPPYKLAIADYDYPLQTLKFNYEKHMNFHKLPFKDEDIAKLNRTEMEEKLKEVYAYKAPKKEEKPEVKANGKFLVCEILPHTEEELEALTREELIAHHDELDTYYYGKVSPSIAETETDVTKQELIGYITELYVNIYDEEQDSLADAPGVVTAIPNTTGRSLYDFADYDDCWN